MRKRLMAMFVALSMIVVVAGCGKGYKIGENGEVYNDYIEIKKWKELEVERVDPVEVTDEDVNLSIESDLQTLTTYVEIKDRGAQNGDQVTIDYVGKIDGVAFEGGTASNQTFILGIVGQGYLLEDFQKGIVGHKAGETFDVAFTFPEDYHEDMAGKAVVFTMTLNKVEEVVTVTELTDEVAQQLNPNIKTVDEYKAQMKADLEASNQETADDTMRSSLFSVLSEQWEVIEYPEEGLEEHTEDTTEYFTSEYESYLSYVAYSEGITVEEVEATYGMTVDQYVSSAYGTTIEEMAKMQYALQMAIDLIAKVEKITVDEEDIDAFVEEMATQAGYEVDEYRELLEEEYDEEELEELLRKSVFQEKVLDFLWENCKIVEPKETETETQTGTETESGSETESTEPVTE